MPPLSLFLIGLLSKWQIADAMQMNFRNSNPPDRINSIGEVSSGMRKTAVASNTRREIMISGITVCMQADFESLEKCLRLFYFPGVNVLFFHQPAKLLSRQFFQLAFIPHLLISSTFKFLVIQYIIVTIPIQSFDLIFLCPQKNRELLCRF